MELKVFACCTNCNIKSTTNYIFKNKNVKIQALRGFFRADDLFLEGSHLSDVYTVQKYVPRYWQSVLALKSTTVPILGSVLKRQDERN